MRPGPENAHSREVLLVHAAKLVTMQLLVRGQEASGDQDAEPSVLACDRVGGELFDDDELAEEQLAGHPRLVRGGAEILVVLDTEVSRQVIPAFPVELVEVGGLRRRCARSGASAGATVQS